MNKYYKVWMDNAYDGSFGDLPYEVHVSDNDDDKVGDWAVFDTAKEAEVFLDLMRENNAVPSDDELKAALKKKKDSHE